MFLQRAHFYCFKVLHVIWQGDELWGSIEILLTPSGLLLWELYSKVPTDVVLDLSVAVSVQSWMVPAMSCFASCHLGCI